MAAIYQADIFCDDCADEIRGAIALHVLANRILPDGTIADNCDSLADLEGYLEDIERQILSTALEVCRWNNTATAKLLGISFRSLRYRLKKLGLDE